MSGGGSPRAQVGVKGTDPVAETASVEPSPTVDHTAVTAESGPGSDAHRISPFAATAPSHPPRRRAELESGSRLAHLRVDAPLGHGGMGDVYRGWDTALERAVAIKVLRAGGEAARKRFLREARAQAKVRHPSVVPIHYVGEHDDVVFISMDLVEGTSIQQRLDEGPIPVDEALEIATEVARALAEGAKSGLVHRDVKPSNILRDQSGRVLLADFGLAKSVGTRESVPADPSQPERADVTRFGSIVGTPAYMAPEQTHPHPVDHRADMYALGATLYEMITGRVPFDGKNVTTLIEQQREATPRPPRELTPDLPPGVEKLVLRLLMKKPEDRFDDYPALLGALDEARVRPAPTAGFFTRTGAMMVDALVIGAVAYPVYLLEPALQTVAVAFAFALMEWRWGRTLGKRLLALQVVDVHNDRPGLGRALFRNAVKFWGGLLVDLAWFDNGAFVIIVGVLWLLSFGVGALPGKRALHDRASRTRVAYALRD